jgi:hypothetical protein
VIRTEAARDVPFGETEDRKLASASGLHFGSHLSRAGTARAAAFARGLGQLGVGGHLQGQTMIFPSAQP